MIYLTDTDFELQIQDVNLQQIISSNYALLENAVLLAISESRSYLIQKFNVDAELLKTQENRDAQLVSVVVDVALYHLHSRIAPRNIPELRKSRYENAIEWLRMCADGSITPAIDKIQPLQGKVNRFGGNPKNINNY